MGNKTTKCPDKSSDSVKATMAKKGETRLMGNGLSPINRVPARWKNLQLYRARNLLFACEIFLAHKFWSINPRVVIPVNLISVDRESEKVAPPKSLSRSFPFFFFSCFFPLLWDARISKRPRVSRVYYSFRGWEKGRSKRDRTRRSKRKARKPASGELLLLYRFVFALFALATVREKSWDVTPGYVELFLEWRMELTY